jgi:hypothetical protein
MALAMARSRLETVRAADGALVSGQVVQDHHIAGVERRSEDLFHARDQAAVMAQSSTMGAVMP